ncbi:hypothetical protein BC059799_B0072 (plasmid) [Bacillus cereus NVH0597-99]|nr:hypothetical protein BC059799_B0072 [Bacillus cereus NVH0597-99]
MFVTFIILIYYVLKVNRYNGIYSILLVIICEVNKKMELYMMSFLTKEWFDKQK